MFGSDLFRDLTIHRKHLLLFTTPTPLFAFTPMVPAVPPGQVVDLACIINAVQDQQLVTILNDFEKKITS